MDKRRFSKLDRSIFMHHHMLVEEVPCPSCGEDKYEVVTESTDLDYMTTDLIFRIVRCLECDLIYLNPRPKLSEISKIYPEEYSAYYFSRIRNKVIRAGRNFMQARKAKSILAFVKNSAEPFRIIDVGCGGPTLLALISKVSGADIRLYGNDFDERALRLVEEAGFISMPGKFEEVAWENNFFDMIVMNQVIEHLFDISAILRKAYQLLKPGGALFIETPSEEGLDAVIFRRHHWGGYHVPRHLLIFSSKTIRSILDRYGFLVETIEFIPSPNFWTSSFRNLLFLKGLPLSLTKRMNYRNVFCMALFTTLDLLTGLFHPTSNMRVVARKPL